MTSNDLKKATRNSQIARNVVELYPAVLDRGETEHNEHSQSSVLRVEVGGRRLPL